MTGARLVLVRVFQALGAALIIVALVSPELSAGFKVATIVLALFIGVLVEILREDARL